MPGFLSRMAAFTVDRRGNVAILALSLALTCRFRRPLSLTRTRSPSAMTTLPSRRRLAAAQGALRIVTGGGSPARPIDKQKAHVEAQNEAAKG